MTKESKVFVGVLVVIVVGLGWIFFSGKDVQPGADTSKTVKIQPANLSLGSVAPPFEVRTIDGNSVSLEDLKGQVVVLTTSAAWCATCIIEAQQFAPVYDKYKDEQVTFLTIDIDSNVKVEQIEQFRQDNSTPWAYAQAAGAKQWIQDYNINRFEITYVIDQEGVIRFKDGEITATKELDEAIALLL